MSKGGEDILNDKADTSTKEVKEKTDLKPAPGKKTSPEENKVIEKLKELFDIEEYKIN